MHNQSEIDMHGCPRSNESVITRVIAGETWLVPISGQLADLEQIYSLNEVGAFIWGHLNGKTSMSTIHGLLTDNFDVTASEAEDDLLQLVQGLAETGLIDQASE